MIRNTLRDVLKYTCRYTTKYSKKNIPKYIELNRNTLRNVPKKKKQKCLLKYSEKYNIIHINESIYAGKKIKRTGRKNDVEMNGEWKKECGKD